MNKNTREWRGGELKVSRPILVYQETEKNDLKITVSLVEQCKYRPRILISRSAWTS